MRRFYAWLFQLPLVVLEDMDGSTCLRIAKLSLFGRWRAVRMATIRKVILESGGRTNGNGWVVSWMPVNKTAWHKLGTFYRQK